MDWITEIVSKLIKKYRTDDPYEIADYKGIIVIREPLGSTLGYHSTYKRISFIHINHELGNVWQRFVCAHELGHNILHPKANTPFLRANTLFSVGRIEREANQFAVELLMPDCIVCALENRARTIQEIATVCGVPQELADLKRIKNMNCNFFYPFR